MAFISKAYHFHSTLEIIWCPKLDTYGIAKDLSIEYRSTPRKDRQLLIHQTEPLAIWLSDKNVIVFFRFQSNSKESLFFGIRP
jgi:hypothetical protein